MHDKAWRGEARSTHRQGENQKFLFALDTENKVAHGFNREGHLDCGKPLGSFQPTEDIPDGYALCQLCEQVLVSEAWWSLFLATFFFLSAFGLLIYRIIRQAIVDAHSEIKRARIGNESSG